MKHTFTGIPCAALHTFAPVGSRAPGPFGAETPYPPVVGRSDMTDASPINRLRRIAARLRKGGDVDGDGTWLTTAVAEYSSGARYGRTLDSALGLTPASSRRGWWTGEAVRARDELLRTIARTYFKHDSNCGVAREIRAQLLRFETTHWPKTRHFMSPPDTLRGVEREFFRLEKLDIPTGLRTIERALRHEPVVVVAGEPADTDRQSEETNGAEIDETITRSSRG
jgi:hypothetical protein